MQIALAAPPFGASLDSNETNQQAASRLQPPDPTTTLDRCQRFRHSGWAAHRTKLYAAFKALHHRESWDLEGAASGRTRLDRFVECGMNAWVVRSKRDPDNLRISASYCKDRFCVPCQATRANRVRTTLNELVQGHRCRLVTLTLRHRPEPLAHTVTRLYGAFAALRRRPWWKGHVDAGAAVVEVKRNAKAGTWHVHFHLIVLGDFLPQRVLSREWLAVTGDSPVVDVRAIWRDARAVDYVTKYLTKQTDASTYNDHDTLCEYVVAMHGRRMIATFGAWRGTRLICEPEHEEWTNVCSLGELLRRVEDGEPAAVALLRQVQGRDDVPETEHPP